MFDEFKGLDAELLNEKSFGHSMRPQSTYGWVGAAIGAAGSLLGGLMSNSGNSGAVKPKVLPKTVSGNEQTAFDFMYNTQAEEDMRTMAQTLETMAGQDRNFYQNVFQPFQQAVLQTNTQMLPTIEKVAGSALEASTRDMVSNESLKRSFQTTAENGFEKGGRTDLAATKFFSELDKMPSEEKMIGNALAQVEGQFSGAGKELARDFAQRGQQMTQASSRDLAIQKAQAKAGAAGQASSQFRQESLGRAEMGLNAAQGLDVQGEALKGQATQGLLSLQARGDQAGMNAMQMQLNPGEFKDGVGEGLMGLSSGLRGADAGKQLGQNQDSNTIGWTQKGIKGAVTQNPDGSVSVGGKTLNSDEYNQIMDAIKSQGRGGAGATQTGAGGDSGIGVGGLVGQVGHAGIAPGVTGGDAIAGLLGALGFGGAADAIGQGVDQGNVGPGIPGDDPSSGGGGGIGGSGGNAGGNGSGGGGTGPGNR